jgi:hypothetical protein
MHGHMNVMLVCTWHFVLLCNLYCSPNYSCVIEHAWMRCTISLEWLGVRKMNLEMVLESSNG